MGYAGYAPGHSVQELTEVIILLLLGVLFVSYCFLFLFLSLSFFLPVNLFRRFEKSKVSRHLFSKRHGPIHLTLTMNHHHYHHRRNKNKIKQKQKALRQVESVECLEMIEKLFKNCAQNPSEKKYRKVKFETNAKIKAAFESGKSTTSNESAVQCFLTHGWVLEEGETNERVLKLPEAVQQTFQDVREVTERKETLQKELQAAFRRRVAARSKAAGASSGGCCSAKEALLKQLEADKLERAAKGPVTTGSKRVDGALGNGGFSTPQDAGCCGSA